jgi:hypothetical protein
MNLFVLGVMATCCGSPSQLRNSTRINIDLSPAASGPFAFYCSAF